MLKIVADENMPLVETLFGDYAQITRLPGRNITQADLLDTDVLLVRSITQINQSLLERTPVAFVGTATIGTDHIDKEYLAKQNIAFADAAGCNAQAVAEYVLTGIAYWAQERAIDLRQITVGIIGAGNVGTRLSKVLDLVGIKYLLNDPLLEQDGDPRDFVALEQIQACDVVTCHVPLTRKGDCSAYHLLDKNFINGMCEQSLLINSARGAVVDNQAALEVKQAGKAIDYIFDVWEFEPKVNPQLLEQCLIGTPHIAGYSQEGKIRGTFMLYQAFCQHFAFNKNYSLEALLPQSPKWKPQAADSSLYQQLSFFYPIKEDDLALRSVIQEVELEFDKLRKNYKNRLEFL